MNVSRICQYMADDVGYTYVDEDGNYWSRVFMNDASSADVSQDLVFPAMLGPISPDEHKWAF